MQPLVVVEVLVADQQLACEGRGEQQAEREREPVLTGVLRRPRTPTVMANARPAAMTIR
ncbi:MAG: hypothetical protein V9E83_01660 [Baekduia sp.]